MSNIYGVPFWPVISCSSVSIISVPLFPIYSADITQRCAALLWTQTPRHTLISAPLTVH